MSRKDFESPEELIDLEGRFLDNYEEMNNFIIFFNKVQEILTSNEKVKVLEINLSRILPKTTKILPFSFIISINSREYLFFIKNEHEPLLTIDELEEYKKLFNENLYQLGLIIVWNDSNLSAILLKEEDLSAPSETVIKIIKNNLLPLEESLQKEVNKREALSKIIKIPIKDIKERKTLNLTKEFEKVLNEILSDYKSKRFRSPKKNIISEINQEDLEKIVNFFSNYLLENFDRNELREKFKEITKK